MPRKKSEFKPLAEKEIVKKNPERRTLVGSRKLFKNLVVEGTKHEPFDKK